MSLTIFRPANGVQNKVFRISLNSLDQVLHGSRSANLTDAKRYVAVQKPSLSADISAQGHDNFFVGDIPIDYRNNPSSFDIALRQMHSGYEQAFRKAELYASITGRNNLAIGISTQSKEDCTPPSLSNGRFFAVVFNCTLYDVKLKE